MPIDVKRESQQLDTLSVGQLLERYREVVGRPSRVRHKQHLTRAIVWNLQAQVEGGLSDCALRRAAELVQNSDLIVRENREAPRPSKLAPSIRPIPGTILCRQYKGRTLQVQVLEDGFEYEGRTFKSLSAVAKAITGSHWNGNRFFGFSSSDARRKTP